MPNAPLASGPLYAVEVRDHIMIAHSFKGGLFGPAQALHGATFVVDVAFMSENLTPEGVVVDIGRATEALKAVLGPLNYRNLDDEPAFAGRNTTTEVVARHIFDAMAAAAREGRLGTGGDRLSRLRVTLHESHAARAWFEGPIGA
ncbi:6-pyruvoyl trahydropterin synthase family protein [Azorhizobium doebereinerae]|uniref:6-pyruvoyl trahydropterin synthase family protein n=1 Tax=Azorhizobium doebereinerae TaxID=281091 RepID=UPI00040DE028|nr:6-carboxytetrahydropterin synthase [Azorhizobium doebereinerae]